MVLELVAQSKKTYNDLIVNTTVNPEKQFVLELVAQSKKLNDLIVNTTVNPYNCWVFGASGSVKIKLIWLSTL